MAMKERDYVFDASYQPQVRAPRGTSNIMLDVIIALLPALCVGVWAFGMKVVLLLAVSVCSCVFFEWIYRKLMKKPKSIGDLSACVTGLLMTLVMPVNATWWMMIIGAFFAIIVVKLLYGGIGKNFINPALGARAFLLASYSSAMTTWAVPTALAGQVDAETMATPLSYLYADNFTALPDYFSMGNLFLGIRPGCIGEISALAILIGFAYLLIRKVITWRIPVSFVGTVAVLCLIFGKSGTGMNHAEWMLYNVLSGGLLLGAIFMATDYATSPVTPKGQLIYGIGCGAITVLIRYFGSYAEGVTYAILLMNLLAFSLDKHTKVRRFGVSKEDEKAEKEAAKKEAKAS